MALIVRCPTCGCIYRVSLQSLRESGGRVRCGVCQTRFNAEDSLRKIDSGKLQNLLDSRNPSPAAAAPAAMSPVSAAAPRRAPAAVPVSPQTAAAARPAAAPSAPLRPEPASSLSGLSRAASGPSSEHSLLWAAGALLLLAVLFWQIISLFGLSAGRYSPPVMALRNAICSKVPCPGPAWKNTSSFLIDDIAISPTSFDRYEIGFTLMNSAAESLPLPSVEVTFTDEKGLILIRKILASDAYSREAAGRTLKASEPLPVRFAFSLSGGVKPASCTVRALPL